MVWAWMLFILLEKEKKLFHNQKKNKTGILSDTEVQIFKTTVLRYNQGYYIYILLVLWYLQLWPESKQYHYNGPYMIRDVSFQPHFF